MIIFYTLGALIVLLGLFIYFQKENRKLKRKEEEILQLKDLELQKKLEQKETESKEKLKLIEKELEERISAREQEFQRQQQLYERQIITQQKLNETEKEKIRTELNGFREQKLSIIENEIKQKMAEAQDTVDLYQKDAQAEIKLIKIQLEEWRAKQTAINEEMRRARELEQEKDFRRIHLNENSKSDIHYLLSIENNIRNKEVLHKLIWTEYLQKPFNQMLKNILGMRNPKNVIYCIENIETKRKYIGKTAGEVSKRWSEHIKSSLGIGTISHQEIHNALFGHWDEFTFSILEEVKDEKLLDREKYYIDFYQADKYGYNMKKGG